MTRSRLVGFIISSLIFQASADETAHSPTILQSDTNFYRDSSLESRLNLMLALGGNEQLSLEAGYARFKTSAENLDVLSAGASLYSDPREAFQFGGGYDVWGNEMALSTHTLSAGLQFNLDRWQFGITPQFRRINVFSEDLSSGPEVVTQSRMDIDNVGANVSLSYFSDGGWAHQLNARYQYYDRDMTVLDVEKYNQAFDDVIQQLQDRGLSDQQIDFILNTDLATLYSIAVLSGLSQQNIDKIIKLRRSLYQASTVLDMFANGLAMSSSFEDYGFAYRLGHYWQRWHTSVELSRSHSAVTRQSVNYVSLGFGLSGPRWNIQTYYSFDVYTPNSWTVQVSFGALLSTR